MHSFVKKQLKLNRPVAVVSKVIVIGKKLASQSKKKQVTDYAETNKCLLGFSPIDKKSVKVSIYPVALDEMTIMTLFAIH